MIRSLFSAITSIRTELISVGDKEIEADSSKLNRPSRSAGNDGNRVLVASAILTDNDECLDLNKKVITGIGDVFKIKITFSFCLLYFVFANKELDEVTSFLAEFNLSV